jgi:hypothetical protein
MICVKKKTICRKNEEQRCPVVGKRAKDLEWN